MTQLIKYEPDERFLEQLPEKYGEMIKVVKESQVEITRATNLFQKSQSQVMDNLLTVTALTPIRNLRQILAEMKRIKQALGEAYFKCRKLDIKIERKERELESIRGTVDSLDIEEKQADLDQILWQKQCIMENVSGAIRKLASYTVQYNAIQEKYKLKGFTEIDFEAEEEAYHISRACQQALTAARARGGIIDEGNLIYFQQLGVPCTVIQQDLIQFLQRENDLLSKGISPDFKSEVNWIYSMMEKFKGCTKDFMSFRGQDPNLAPIAMEE